MATAPRTRARTPWALLVIALPAAVAVWSGWVELGGMCGFGVVHPLPGTPLAGWSLDTSITLPIGVEAYAAYAMATWMGGAAPARARRFAAVSAVAALALGAAAQAAYHLLAALGHDRAPTPVVVAVATLPVAVLGAAAALHHLAHEEPATDAADAPAAPAPAPVAAPPVPVAAPAAPAPAPIDTPPATAAIEARPASTPDIVAGPARPDDADHLTTLRQWIQEHDGTTPTLRQVKDLLGVGQTRAQRIIAQLGPTPVRDTQETTTP